MKIRSLFIGAAVMIMSAIPAFAGTVTTGDGVLSIDTPSDAWVQTVDPNCWFVVSDGKNVITIDHLSNGESLPAVAVADENYGGVYQAFVSTKNEVFVVKGLAATQEELGTLMQAIGTIKVLQYDTKTAIQKEAAPSASQFSLREINATYYVTGDEINVRTGCSTNDPAVGSLYRGEEVNVIGAVTKDGADFGWYQISFNGSTAYVASGFLSQTKPANNSNTNTNTSTNSGTNTKTENGQQYVQCEYCGEWILAGNDYRNHVFAMHLDESAADNEAYGTDLVQCEYCGEWFHEGNDYRNHVFAMHTGAASGDGENDDYDDEDEDGDLVQCEYCGEWFHLGNEIRNHMFAMHREVTQGDGENYE